MKNPWIEHVVMVPIFPIAFTAVLGIAAVPIIKHTLAINKYSAIPARCFVESESVSKNEKGGTKRRKSERERESKRRTKGKW